MGLLISRGVFRRRRDGRFALNALGDTLRTDSPISMRGAALLYGSPQHRANWTRLADTVRTGEPNPPKVFGKDFFDYLPDDPELGLPPCVGHAQLGCPAFHGLGISCALRREL